MTEQDLFAIGCIVAFTFACGCYLSMRQTLARASKHHERWIEAEQPQKAAKSA